MVDMKMVVASNKVDEPHEVFQRFLIMKFYREGEREDCTYVEVCVLKSRLSSM